MDSTSANNGHMFIMNSPSNADFQLSPLFSSFNANDIQSVRTRTARVWGAGSPFANNDTNAPTITIGSVNRTISHLFMNDNNNTSDDLGIRVSGSSLSYSANQSSAWTGTGLNNKPIVDFFAGTYNSPGNLFTSSSGMQVTINSEIILEPKEYALLFGLFALDFALLHRQIQKKQKATAS